MTAGILRTLAGTKSWRQLGQRTVLPMRILLIGAGGVGSAFCAIAARRDFFDSVVVCDYDEASGSAAETVPDERFSSAQVDASSAQSVADLVRDHSITHVMNAVDPRFVMPIFEARWRAAPTTSTWR